VTLPRLVSDVKPHYAPEAMRAKNSGTILLEGVVRVDGTVTDIHVVGASLQASRMANSPW
jgi:outer membrane biosynthesis protein TonB